MKCGYVALLGVDIGRGKLNYWERVLSLCHLVYHKSDMDWHGIEPEPAHWKLVIKKLCSNIYCWLNVVAIGGQLVTQSEWQCWALQRRTDTTVIFVDTGLSGARATVRLLDSNIVQSCLWVPNLVINVVTLSSSLYAGEGDSRLPPDGLVAESRKTKCRVLCSTKQERGWT